MTDSDFSDHPRGEPVFRVTVGNEDFNPGDPPVTGEDYLKRVILEARRCDDVVVVEIDHQKVRKQTVKVDELTGCCPPPAGYGPTAEWQRCQVADFSCLRVSLEKAKKSLIYWHRKNPSSITVPKMEDDIGWCRLCLGNQAHIKCRSTAGGDKMDEDRSDGMQPLLSILLSMNQPTVECVLEYHVQWLGDLGFSQLQGRWLYALLTFLEKPLTPEACSLLRGLARLCSTLRAALDSPSHPHLTALNLLISLVAHYFDQGDLADRTL